MPLSIYYITSGKTEWPAESPAATILRAVNVAFHVFHGVTPRDGFTPPV